MKSTVKKGLSWMLALALVCALLPAVAVFARAYGDQFNGEAYFCWANSEGTLSYHKFTNLDGSEMNYVAVAELTDDSGNWENYAWGTEPANWALADDIEDQNGNVKPEVNMQYVFGDGQWDMGIQLDPCCEAAGASSIASNADRNFRAIIYREDRYEAVAFGASAADYTYFPSFWDPTFFQSTVDVSVTTQEAPAVFQTSLLNSSLTFKTGLHSKSEIRSAAVAGSAVPAGAVEITRDDQTGEFTVTFGSDFFDSVVLKLEAEDGGQYYLELRRVALKDEIVRAPSEPAKYSAVVFYPNTLRGSDFQVVVRLRYADGSAETRVLSASSLNDIPLGMEMLGLGNPGPDEYTADGGKGLYCSVFWTELDPERGEPTEITPYPVFQAEGACAGVRGALNGSALTTLTAAVSNGKLNVTATAPEGTLAVAVQLLEKTENGTKLLDMQTAGVKDEIFSLQFDASRLAPEKEYTVRAADYDGGAWKNTAVPRCTVSFDADGGTPVPADQIVFSGGKATKPADPKKDGHTLEGWYSDPALTAETKVDFDTFVIRQDTTFYAKWTVNLYTVTFDADGGMPIPPDQSVSYGGKATKPDDPKKTGHTLEGWYWDPARTAETKVDFDAYAIEQDTTFYAKWTVNLYTVTFDADGGMPIPPDQSVSYGGKATKPDDPQKTGHTLEGWYWDPARTAETKVDFDAYIIEQDTTFYAKWTANLYTITFDTDGGTAIEPITQAYGTKVTPPDDPTRAGYTFSRWEPAIPETMPDENLTVKAIWTKKSAGGIDTDINIYRIVIAKSPNGTTTASHQSAAAGTKITVTATPDAHYALASLTVTDTGGKTVSMENGAFIMPASDVMVTAVYELMNPFEDVSEDDWFFEAVCYCYSRNYLWGVSETRFDPNGDMSRAMFATVLYRIAGEPSVEGLANPFPDVKAGQWYTDAVLWAAAKKLVGGYEDGTFRPDAPVTREQLAAVLYRYAQNKDKGFRGAWFFPLHFPDASEVSDWADKAMHWMVMNGVVKGKDGRLVPGGNATRAEVAMMLMRFCELAF